MHQVDPLPLTRSVHGSDLEDHPVIPPQCSCSQADFNGKLGSRQTTPGFLPTFTVRNSARSSPQLLCSSMLAFWSSLAPIWPVLWGEAGVEELERELWHRSHILKVLGTVAIAAVVRVSSQITTQNLSHSLALLECCCVFVELPPTFSDGISGPPPETHTRAPHRSAVQAVFPLFIVLTARLGSRSDV